MDKALPNGDSVGQAKKKFIWPDKQTFLLMGICFISAMVFAFPYFYKDSFLGVFVFLFFYIAAGMHECGHAITGWLFGIPSVPTFMLFTQSWNRSVTLQIVIIALLCGLSYRLKSKDKDLFHSALLLTAIIVILSLSGQTTLIVTYMGHGGSILIAGYFLFRAWIRKDKSDTIKQAFFGFIGFYTILQNIDMCRELIVSESFRNDYKMPGGLLGIDNDFFVISKALPWISMQQIAAFTILLGIIIMFFSFLIALSFLNNYRDKKLAA